jgi:hypothetical protein
MVRFGLSYWFDETAYRPFNKHLQEKVKRL